MIGDVVSNNDNVSTGKSMFDGKEYDYVFNIDIGDGIPALKLPFNNDQDPYTVAQVMQKFRRNRNSYQTLDINFCRILTPICFLYFVELYS